MRHCRGDAAQLSAQLEQNRAESHRREEEARESVVDIAAKLERLMQQLNEYRLVSETDAIARCENLSSDVDARLQVQSLRMDEFSKSMQEARNVMDVAGVVYFCT